MLRATSCCISTWRYALYIGRYTKNWKESPRLQSHSDHSGASCIPQLYFVGVHWVLPPPMNSWRIFIINGWGQDPRCAYKTPCSSRKGGLASILASRRILKVVYASLSTKAKQNPEGLTTRSAWKKASGVGCGTPQVSCRDAGGARDAFYVKIRRSDVFFWFFRI